MKRLRNISLLIILAVTAFVACQKEFSVDTGLIPGQRAAGSLRDTSGNCLPDSVHGTWYNGITPGDTNYVEIKVNVDSLGSYVIYTNSQNGLSFRDSGTFTSKGLNTVRLKPTGTAVSPDTTLFAVYFDTSVCEFALPVRDSTGSGLGNNTQAEFTLSGSPDVCMQDTVYGKWAEQAVLDSNRNVVTLEVDVTKVGKYAVSTATINGISFSGSGTFTTTGTQEITLYGKGTPTVSGTNTFPVTVGSSNCSFDVFVINSINASNTSWQFSEGTNNYSGFTISSYILDTANFKVLYINGVTPSTFDTVFRAAILYSSAEPSPGEYSTAGNTALFEFMNSTDTLYNALPNDATVDTKITVTAYDATTKTLDATFAGTAIAPGRTANITNGKLKIKVDQ